MSEKIEISTKGKIKSIPHLKIGNYKLIKRGRVLQSAAIFDEFWLKVNELPEYNSLIKQLRSIKGKPDIFTFTQRVPDEKPKYEYYYEFENYATIPLSTYDHWFSSQISSATKRNIRASEKRGIAVEEVGFDEAYVKGIMGIYNETPFRQGRKFWHYGKSFSSVYSENSTYADRSSFLAAYYEGAMVGYLKIVWDKESAAIMQILSKMQFRDKRPNNALLAKAVDIACERRIAHLLYERYVYGNKSENSLTKFKQSNGFIRMDVPKFYVPLTKKGSIALHMGLHRDLKERLPEIVMEPFRNIRSRWYGQ